MERPVRGNMLARRKTQRGKVDKKGWRGETMGMTSCVEQGWFAVENAGGPQRDVRLGRDQRGWLAVGSVGQRPRGDCRREQAAAHLVCHLLGPVGAVLGLSCNRLGVSVKGPSGAISGFPWDCSVFVSQAL